MAYVPGLSRELVKAAAEAPYLEKEEEKRLAVAWREREDRRALDKLVGAHIRLVIATAARFRHYSLPVADLVQEGHVGLMEAAARFEPERDLRFSTYATWWIRAAMQEYVLRNWSIVRGGMNQDQKALFFNLRRLRARLAQSDPTGDHLQAIAERLGVPRKDVEMMNARLGGGDQSLNEVMGGSEEGVTERMDFLVDDSPLPDEITEKAIDAERHAALLKEALKVLNERELRILQARRLDEEPTTLGALGEKLGISKERVRQIENRSLEKLRRALKEINEAMNQALLS